MKDMLMRCLLTIVPLAIVGNLIFVLTFLFTPKPSFKKGRHYSDKAIEKQQKIMSTYRKMIKIRFIIMNSVPCVLLIISIFLSFFNNERLNSRWPTLNLVISAFTLIIYLIFLKMHRTTSEYDIADNGGVRFSNSGRIHIVIVSFIALVGAVICAYYIFK